MARTIEATIKFRIDIEDSLFDCPITERAEIQRLLETDTDLPRAIVLGTKVTKLEVVLK